MSEPTLCECCGQRVRIEGDRDNGTAYYVGAEAAIRDAEVMSLREGIKKADELLACMWSYNEQSRAKLGHLCSVQASVNSRTAREFEPGVMAREELVLGPAEPMEAARGSRHHRRRP